MRIALVGNPNAGKTTLFNELTGANQHVGNWPGVTVEKKEGKLRSQYGEADVIDLPGIYSLSPNTLEEVVSRDYIVHERPSVVIDVVEGTNLERNLYLSVQLMELDVPIVIALNMMDEVAREGIEIDVEHLERHFGVPVIPISAARKQGVDVLMAALSRARRPKRHELPNPALERLIAQTEHLLHDHLDAEHKLDGDYTSHGFPLHWCAIKVLEGDDLVLDQLTLDAPTQAAIDKLKNEFEAEHTLLCTAFADARYRFIHHVVHHAGDAVGPVDEGIEDEHHPIDMQSVIGDILPPCAIEGAEKNGSATPATATAAALKLNRSDKIDRILTHKVWSIPIFLFVMFAMFHLTFSESLFGIPDVPSPGVWMQGMMEELVTFISDGLAPLFTAGGWAQSLVIDGVIGGVGSVLSFVPQILLLFFFLTLLEDCGYMARAAFVMNRVFHRFGLSGKSALPMLMGFGCTVPAAMACRTLENEQERRLTLMIVPFMSCGARAPIFIAFAAAFFASYQDFIIMGLYLLGIIVALLSSIVLKKLLFKGETAPFIIELPRYRAPRAFSVLIQLWDKLKGYLVRAGTIIFAMSVVIWFFQSFGFTAAGFGMVEDINTSMLAAIGGFIAPVFTPLGFGTAFAAVAILTGFVAKEAVIGTLGVMSGTGEDEALEGGLGPDTLATLGFTTPLISFSFMVFCLLYLPCVAAFATLKKEFGSWKWALGQAAFTTGVAYVMAFLVFQVGTLLGLGG